MKKTVKKRSDRRHREVLKYENALLEREHRIYKFGFWLFFVITLFSVLFSVWAITSIYANFRVVTNILDDAFERTNLVLDISTGKIEACQTELAECKGAVETKGSG